MPYAGLFSFVTARSDGAITARDYGAMYWREITGSLVNTANSLLFDASLLSHKFRFDSLPKQADGTGFWFISWTRFLLVRSDATG